MSAKVIAVYNQKGGCGKSMTTMQVGGSLGLLGYKVLIVDMDKQGTSVIWFSSAPVDSPFPADVINLAPAQEKMLGVIQQNFEAYDFIFIDCPPAIESSIPWAALNIADLGIIPVAPVMDNIWASREAKELYLKARQNRPALMAVYLWSIVSRGKVFDNCKEILRADPDVGLLSAQLSRRNAFPESQIFGCTVGALDDKSAATEEIRNVMLELLALFNMKPRKSVTRIPRKRSPA